MPTISVARLQELEAAEKALKEKEELECIKPFVADMLEGIGAILAVTPFKFWPEPALIAFRNYALKYPVPAQLYKDRLPQN